MLLQYTYANKLYSFEPKWNDLEGHSIVFCEIVCHLDKFHGGTFSDYLSKARLLDLKVDELYHCVYIFNNEHYAVPYDPHNRDRFLKAFSDLCSCLNTGIGSDHSEPAQVLLQLFHEVQGVLQEMVGIYLVDHAYQNKHFKRMRRLECRILEEVENRMTYEFDSRLIGLLDLSQTLECLSASQRRRIIKYFVLGQTYQQIADQEGVSVQAVRYSVLAALDKLRMLM